MHGKRWNTNTRRGSLVQDLGENFQCTHTCCAAQSRQEDSHSHPKRSFVGCWNCRGLSGSELYIQTLIRDSPGVLVLAEHWLLAI